VVIVGSYIVIWCSCLQVSQANQITIVHSEFAILTASKIELEKRSIQLELQSTCTNKLYNISGKDVKSGFTPFL
jgi:hypothetical protein